MTSHEDFLRQAIEIAKENALAGGRPFGTVIVNSKTREVISTGKNIVHITNDPTDHGEIVALREACRKLGKSTLEECDVYAIAHPCPMCMTALILAKAGHVYYAATLDDKARNGLGLSGAIYDELKRAPTERSIPMTLLEATTPASVECFQTWQQFSGVPQIQIPTVLATEENIKDYGLLISEKVHNPGLSIPFYKGSVQEGANFDFVCNGPPTARTARIIPRSSPEVTWLERHMRMTQVFIGLGHTPFIMVLGKPNHASGAKAPNLEDVRAFIMPPGHGLMIHQGTWHDFPVAISDPVTVLTFNSAEVVEALASMKAPGEMDHGDVFKIRVVQHTGKRPMIDFNACKEIAKTLV